MSRQIVALCTVLALLTVPSYQQGSQGSTVTSPCPNVFKYDPPSKEPGWWSGIVTLSSDILLHSVWLNIVLDSPALSLGQVWDWIGNATTQDRVDFRIDNEDMKIHPGHPVLARFYIQYDPLNTTPRLRSIRLNGKVICKGQPGSSFGEQKLYTNLDMMPVQAPQSEPSYSDYPRPVNNCSAAFKSDHVPKTPITTSRCGEVAGGNERVSLINNSHYYDRGEIPWLVAIYRSVDIFLHIICTGTLASDRHVVTAAHCAKRGYAVIPTENIVVKIGIHRLNDWDDDITITRKIKAATIHEEYDSKTFQNDIMVLTLIRRVSFNSYIRPACLWSGDTELSRVVGAVGVVAGWGERFKGEIDSKNEPQMVRVPIVSTAECRASNSEFHKVTYNTTLCAGARNGAGSCTGNYGGGLYLLEDSKWRLRGVISLPLNSDNVLSINCNLQEFIVFTDTAQFLPWIRNILSMEYND